MQELSKTSSLCPECLSITEAIIFEDAGKVWIKKECGKHGQFTDMYWGDFDSYKKVLTFSHEGKGIENANILEKNPVCPKACGLCSLHKTHTALGNVVVTNRCDLTCFYCFFYAQTMGYIYEPSLEQIRVMLRKMREEKPIACKALQLTGGEPTMHKDILEVIKIAKQEGYSHVQLNTNGIRMAYEPQFVENIFDAGVNSLYLSFDGVSPKTNPKNHYEIPLILQNSRLANSRREEKGLPSRGIVLVPTVINTVNDHEVGAILEFGLKNIDSVRGVNYQPVSLVGRITRADVKKYRITIPDVISRLADQIGIVEKDDFYPIPSVTPISYFVEELSGFPKYELTTHSVCGMATYLFLDGQSPVPITRFVDVTGLLEYLEEKAQEIRKGESKIVAGIKVLAKLNSFIDSKKQPKDINFGKIIFDILTKGNYHALRVLHHKTLFIGMMHFMDLWNYDVERVKRCCIHYAQPDGRIVPFCAFNVIPQWYRDKIQEKYGMSIAEWERKTDKRLRDDFYKRDIKVLESNPLYRKTYEGFVRTV